MFYIIFNISNCISWEDSRNFLPKTYQKSLKFMVTPRGDSLLFANKSPRIPGTHIIDLEMFKGWVNLRATQWFLIGNPVP